MSAEEQTIRYMQTVNGEYSKGYHLFVLQKNYIDENGKAGQNRLVDLTNLAGDIQHTTSFIDNPAKLSFYIQKDVNNIVTSISNGDMVMFMKTIPDKDGNLKTAGIFKGYVFTVGFDATKIFRVTAYDQTRYLKNEDNMIVKNMTIAQLFEKICVNFQLKYDIPNNVKALDYVLPAKIYQGKTLYSILKENIQKTENYYASLGSGNKVSIKLMIRDNYGTLELVKVEDFMTNIVLGDESLLSSYKFETSIDKNTYTQIKVTKQTNVSNNEQNTKNTQVYVQKDTNAQKQWGIIQKVVQADENMNNAQVKQLAENWLKLSCKETKSLNLSALGIIGFNAGVGFRLSIKDLGVALNMYILEASHKFTKDFHTMELTVNANDLEVYFK